MRTTLLLAALLFTFTSCASPEPAGTSRVNVEAPPATPQATPPSTTQAQPVRQPADAQPADPTERWWVSTPQPVEGKLRVIASGRSTSLIDARQLAVDNAHDLLARSLGRTPEDATIERTAAEKVGEHFTAWVLISTDSNP